MPETRPTSTSIDRLCHGRVILWGGRCLLVVLGLSVCAVTPDARAGDGASEALELRLVAERMIAHEAAQGHDQLAAVMRELLPAALVDDLVTRDEGVTIDTVDAAFVAEQFKMASAMEEPGVAMALEVFAGPGTGQEQGIRTSLARLADFKARKADTLPDMSRAVEVHERVMERHLEKLQARVDVLEQRGDRADRLEKALSKAEKTLEKAADKAAKALAEGKDDKADKTLEKAADKADKTLEKAADPTPDPDPAADPDPAPQDKAKDKPAKNK